MARKQLGVAASNTNDAVTKGYVDAASNSYSATIGNGSSTSIAVTHNLGTMDVVVSVYRISTGKEVDCDVTKTDGNTITLTFATAPASNSLRCTIIGTAFGNGTPAPVSSLGITDATATGRSLITATDAAAARTTIGSPLFIDVAAAPYNVTPATIDPEIKIQEAIDYAAANGIPEVIISRPGTYTVGLRLHSSQPSTGVSAALWGRSNLKLTMKPGVVIKLKDNATRPTGSSQMAHIISVIDAYSTDPAKLKTNWHIEGGVIDGNAANQSGVPVDGGNGSVPNGASVGIFINARSSSVKNVVVKNIWGDWTSPPGETFHFDANNSRDVHFVNCEADGSGSIKTATGFSANNSFGVTWTNCVAHSMGAGLGFTIWMSSSISYVGCRAYGNFASGFNSERSQYVTYAGCVSGGKSPTLSDDYAALAFFPSGVTPLPNGDGFSITGSSHVTVTGCVAENTNRDLRIGTNNQPWMTNPAERAKVCNNILVSNCIFSNNAGYDSETILRGVVVESVSTGGLDQIDVHLVDCQAPSGSNGALSNYSYAPIVLWRTKPGASGVRFFTTGGDPGSPAYRWFADHLGGGVPLLTLDSSGQVLTAGRRMARRAVSGNANIAVTDEVIAVTNTSAPRTITLPAAATAGSGATYLIQDETGTASNTNPIIVAAAGADLIEGVASKTIRTAYGQLRVVSTGSSWVVDGLDSMNPLLDNPKMDIINASNGFRSIYVGADGDGSSYLAFLSAGSGGAPGIYAQSGDANTSINLGPKGSGRVNLYATTGNTPTIMGTGQDTNHDLNLATKGTGVVRANGVDVVTTTGTQTLSNKTLSGNTIHSVNGTIELYNTADQTTNYEKLAARFTSNVAEIVGLSGGTGAVRPIKLGVASAANGSIARFLQAANVVPFLSFQWGATGVQGNTNSIGTTASSYVANSGTQVALSIDPTCSQTGTAGYTMLLVNPTETNNTGSGTKLLADFQVGGTSKLAVDNTGRTLHASGGTIELYNTADQTTNYERVRGYWSSNTFNLFSEAGGTGTSRAIQFGATAYLRVSGAAASINRASNTAAGALFTVAGTYTSTVANQIGHAITPTISQGSTASYTGLQVNVTESSLGSGPNLLADFQIGGTTKAKIDNTGVITGLNHVSTKTSTATAAGTTTLTIASSQVQEFTGSTTQTVNLPTTGITAGQSYTIINNSTGALSINASGGGSITTIGANGKIGIFTARIDTPTLATDWFSYYPSASVTNSSIVIRDSYGNINADVFVPSSTSVATSAGTTTLTIGSTQTQVFTGSSTQTVKLPTTSVTAGQTYTIVNQSSGDVTVQSSGSNTIATLTGASSPTVKLFVALQDSPTTDAHWRAI